MLQSTRRPDVCLHGQRPRPYTVLYKSGALNCDLEVVSYGNYDYVISVGFHVPTFNVFFNDFNMCNPKVFQFVPFPMMSVEFR